MIIKSLLDTDLYKFTMMQTVLHQFPGANCRYNFKCRTKDINLAQYKQEIEDEISHLCALRFNKEELKYLSNLRYMKSDFIDFLSIFHLQKKYVEVQDLGNGEIDIVIEGPWLHTILFEVPVLAIVNEVYFKNEVKEKNIDQLKIIKNGTEILNNKIDFYKKNARESFIYSDFGTRRRFSASWQKMVLENILNKDKHHFKGTSNVLLAKELNLVPVGTMAHEYLQAAQALGPKLADSQIFALEKWAQEYRGDLGIALTDVIGVDAFLNDFDMYFAKLFDGVRHDSGDPYEWAQKFINHYEKLGVNSKEKSLVFSDGLDFSKAIDLEKQFGDKAKIFAGIGTNLTNDVGFKPINIVLKMTECNGSPVAKLSDSPGKSMCKDMEYMNYLKSVFEKKLIQNNSKKIKIK